MIPREGFATNDSGVQPDGSVVAKHAFGGWEKASSIRVKAAAWTRQKKADGASENVLVVWEVPPAGVAKQKSAWVWIGGDPELTDSDMDGATKFQPGRPPGGMTETMPKAVNALPPEANIRGGGVIGKLGGVVKIEPRWSGKGQDQPKKTNMLSGTWQNIYDGKGNGIPTTDTWTFLQNGTYIHVQTHGNVGQFQYVRDISKGTYVIESDQITMTGKIVESNVPVKVGWDWPSKVPLGYVLKRCQKIE